MKLEQISKQKKYSGTQKEGKKREKFRQNGKKVRRNVCILTL
jgi:hypothetical protein